MLPLILSLPPMNACMGGKLKIKGNMMRRLIPLWFLLHVQHTGQFLFIWVSTILDGGSCLVPLWRDVWVSATFAIFYALWGSFRWCVATRPAYPLLEKISATFAIF